MMVGAFSMNKVTRLIKRIAILLVIVLVSHGLLAQGKNFQLIGRIEGVSTGKAVLNIFWFSETEKPFSDTASIVNGEFNFRGTIPSPVLADITILPNKLRMAVFLEGGTVSVRGDTSLNGRSEFLPVTVTGSNSHREYEGIASYSRREVDSLYALTLHESDAARKTALRDQIDRLNEKITDNTIRFIETHLNSPVSAYYMIFNTSDYNMSFRQLKKIVTGFGPVPKSTPYYKRIREEYDVIAKIQPGMKAPEFVLKTPEDEPFALSGLKGKYVLLDFWASWCAPCRQSFPRMKDTYERYRDKGFEILGVSDDSKKEAWLKAIADDKLPWAQVVDEFPVRYKPARVCTLYGIHYLPTTILIDREGMIIAKNLHEQELEDTLARVLKE